MKATPRLLFIFFLLLILFSVGLTVYSRMEHANLLRIQQSEVAGRKVSFEKILKLNQQAIFVLANDYSYWDELVNAIKNEDVQWAFVNIDSGIKTYGADAAWVYNMDVKRIYSVNRFVDDRLKDLPLTPAQVKEMFNGQALVHFYIATPAGYLEIQGATVHPSDDSERKTPAQGYFFVGKLWNKEYLDTIAQLTGCKIALLSIKDVVGLKKDNDTFIVPVDDWKKSPLFLVSATVESTAIDHFQSQSRILLQLFLFYTMMQMLCLLYFLRKFFRKT
jgi:sensor domain CHASE-containing protein